MAQWLGQYSGHTHESRVEDLEGALRLAIHAFTTATSEAELRSKAKSARNLAKRLLSARHRVLKARLVAALRVVTEEAHARRATEVESLRQREATLLQSGVQGILKEFAAPDAMTT